MTDRKSFDDVYRERRHYYGGPSDGLIECIRRHDILPCRAADVGCGQGRNAIWLAEQGFDVLATDISHAAIQQTREDAERLGLKLTALVGDIGSQSLNVNEFGLIVLQTTLNQIEAAKLPSVCRAVENALVESGVLYCVVFTASAVRASSARVESECAGLVEHLFEPGELKRCFRSLRVLEYAEYEKLDTSHGRPHTHSKAKLVGRRGQ